MSRTPVPVAAVVKCTMRSLGGSLPLAIRVDDICKRDATADRLARDLIAAGGAVDLAVIPGQLTHGGARWIERLATLPAARVRVHQHGWKHTNHEGARGRRSEFGQSRNLEEQRADLAAGQSKLRTMFGELVTPVFCPPWNRACEAAVSLLPSVGFRGISAFGRVEPRPHDLIDLSATIDWDRSVSSHDDYTAARACLSLLEWFDRAAQVVVMVHPIGRSPEYVRQLVSFVTTLVECGARPQLFSDMLAVKERAHPETGRDSDAGVRPGVLCL